MIDDDGLPSERIRCWYARLTIVHDFFGGFGWFHLSCGWMGSGGVGGVFVLS